MLKIFETNEEYNNYIQSEPLLISGVLYYIKEDNSAHFSTNNIGGEYKIYDLGGELATYIYGAAIYAKYNKTKDYSTDPYISWEINSINCVFLDGEYISGDEVRSKYAQFPLENGEHEALFILNTNEIPNNFFHIDSCADMLTEIVVSDYYTSIGDNFIGTNAPQLKKLTLGNRIINIGDEMIYQGYEETNTPLVNIPQNIETIGSSAYRGSGIKKAIFPNTITSIGGSAFYMCSKLEEVYIPDSDNTITIGGSAFSTCKSLKKLYLGKGVTLSTSSVFDNCHIEEVTFNSSTTQNYTGDKWNSLKKLVINNNVTEVENGAFSGSKKLESVTILSTNISLPKWAFNNCPKLKEVKISEGCKSIGQECFSDDPKLTELELPSTVTSIAKWGFSRTSLTSLTVHATTPPTAGGYLGMPNNCKIYVPAASVSAYKAATNWADYADNIEAIP